MDDDAVTCRGLTKAFGSVRALAGLDLDVARGAVVGFLGPNGAGKSTTLRILLGLARPDGGEVLVLGADPRRSPAAHRRAIGYLPGELRLDERMGVDETLRYWAGVRGNVDATEIERLCDAFDLDRRRPVRGLSSGNRRKLGLVGAFMGRPELLVLDEPTAGVDPLVQAAFLDLVDEVRADGRTVLLSSHVLSEVQRMADQVVVIRAGRTVASGSVEQLRQAARQPFTAWFGTDPPMDELRRLPGVDELEVRGREVRGVVVGAPGALLELLARSAVEHLLLPEPDLEAAFLRFYEEDGDD